MPSNLLTHSLLLGKSINGAFIVDLKDYIKKCGASYWIFGYSHRNIDKIIGKTNCLCNQLGYLASKEDDTFDRGKIIVLKDIGKIDKNCSLY